MTNTTVSTAVESYINVLRRGKGYMDIDLNQTCVNESVRLLVSDGEYGTPLQGASAKVYLNGIKIRSLSALADGILEFIPTEPGSYSIEITMDGFATEMLNTSIQECIAVGNCSDYTMNCHDGSCETGIDCGGPCPPCENCFNGVRDNGETGIDCGGSCMPCHCTNGVMDGSETGIDCGGSCMPCPNLPFIPALSINAPSVVATGTQFNITVFDDKGNPVNALIKINKSDGTEMLLMTDSRGFTQAQSDVSGLWSLTAVKPGYLPSSAGVYMTKEQNLIYSLLNTSYQLITSGYSLLLLLVLLVAILYFVTRRSRRDKTEQQDM
jgi:hypothetical protein